MIMMLVAIDERSQVPNVATENVIRSPLAR
jgi:hypothetical protein